MIDADSMEGALTNGTLHDAITFANNATNYDATVHTTTGGTESTDSFMSLVMGNNQQSASSVLLSLDSTSADFLRPDAMLLDGSVANPGGFFDAAPYRGAVDPNAGSANWLQASWISYEAN